jgi:hypothetical protein
MSARIRLCLAGVGATFIFMFTVAMFSVAEAHKVALVTGARIFLLSFSEVRPIQTCGECGPALPRSTRTPPNTRGRISTC